MVHNSHKEKGGNFEKKNTKKTQTLNLNLNLSLSKPKPPPPLPTPAWDFHSGDKPLYLISLPHFLPLTDNTHRFHISQD
jgi:hypothetical protein